ncbi:class I SAM-dependent methyltransferase [Nocardia abscessus]|uniref:class I SAM-dependent methyltransferase n=1 Tax=Nocardia abscessus TaxID=120957 RepID=UPI000316EACC|nr:class I SAM-dependent methyltransferase [Nocardia abscessus]MCC3328286.1 class I SAM-dependent methyltransferase [Nocardia abscessus]
MNTSGPTLSSEYATTTPLQVRIDTHTHHSEHPDDPISAVLDALELTGTEALADIGCGDGRFLAQLAEHGHRGRLVGVDNSAAMVTTADARPGVSGVLGNAEQLPLTDGEFDRTTARHMLYHVPDPGQALRELRRITRPGGRVAVTVNHPGTCTRTRQLVLDHARRCGLNPAEELTNSVNSTTLAPMMRAVFPDTQIRRFDNALIFDTAAPLIRFAEALFSFCGVSHDSPHRAAILAAVTANIEEWFTNHRGEVWRDPKGYIVATAILSE